MYRIVLLNKSNFQEWKIKIEALLKREGSWKAIVSPRPTVDGDKQTLWDNRDEKAQGTIALFIENDQNHLLEGATTSKLMWEALKAYHEKSTGANKYMLVTELFSLKLKEGGDMEKHMGRMQTIIKNLVTLGCKSVSEFGVYVLLHSLPPSYETLVSNIWSKPEDELTMQNVKASLIGEYRRRRNLSATSDEQYDTAMKVIKPPRKNLDCFFCDKPGHTKADCREMKSGNYTRKNQDGEQQQRRSRATVKAIATGPFLCMKPIM